MMPEISDQIYEEMNHRTDTEIKRIIAEHGLTVDDFKPVTGKYVMTFDENETQTLPPVPGEPFEGFMVRKNMRIVISKKIDTHQIRIAQKVDIV
jgi:hypothetical protein